MRRLAAFAAVALVCAGILMALLSPITVLNAVAWALGGYALEADIAYAPGARHELDLYRPDHALTGAPVIVFFYGGGWDSGDRAMYRFVAAALARRGFTVAVPDYRLYPEARFADFMDDAARAVAFVQQRVASGAPTILMGHSAGAHIAAMLSLDGEWLGRYGLSPSRDVAALVGLSGPYDFLPLTSPTLKAIFGPESGLAATQPIHFVSHAAPRAFLATARDDSTVDPGNTERLAARIRSAGGDVEEHIYDRLNHQTMIGVFSVPLRPLAPVLDDVEAFIRR